MGKRYRIDLLATAVREFERGFLLDALRRAGGSIAQVARDVGVQRRTLENRIISLDLRADVDAIREARLRGDTPLVSA